MKHLHSWQYKTPSSIRGESVCLKHDNKYRYIQNLFYKLYGLLCNVRYNDYNYILFVGLGIQYFNHFNSCIGCSNITHTVVSRPHQYIDHPQVILNQTR